MNRRNSKEENGITLLALSITIIILLILAGITIAGLTGKNGLINNAGEVKKQTEIANEKEILERVTAGAMAQDSRGNIKKENLQNKLNNETGEGKTEVSDVGEEFEVLFTDSNRYYTIDKNGNIGDSKEFIEDKNPGDITKDQNGNTVDGSIDHPYEIWCIEDLVVFSNLVNGEGIELKDGKAVKIENAKDFYGEYVVLKRSLNFKSKYSYANSERTDFGDINGNAEDGNTLMNEMTTGTGFKPIGRVGNYNYFYFKGNFDGENNSINNLYKNGFFGYITSAEIKNIKLYSQSKNRRALVNEAGGDVIINNCHNFINVGKVDYENDIRYAGIISYNTGDIVIINCSNHGKITGSGYAIGGIIGYSTAIGKIYISNTYNTGEINFDKSGISYSGAGGIIGLNQYANANIEINNCYNTGNITGKAVYNGSIIGNTSEATTIINNSYIIENEGTNIIGNKGEYTGNVEVKTLEEIKSQEFVDTLNNNILDKENWNKWYLGKDNFPTCEK